MNHSDETMGEENAWVKLDCPRAPLLGTYRAVELRERGEWDYGHNCTSLG